MDIGAWGATVHGITNSRTRRSEFHFHFQGMSLQRERKSCELGTFYLFIYFGFLADSVEKNLPDTEGDTSLIWVGKILWRRKWQPSLVFLPGESHEQRGLAGYTPWGSKKNWIRQKHLSTAQ